MIIRDYEGMAAELYLYDVKEGNWENDPEAFEDAQTPLENVQHVAHHLGKSFIEKDYFDPDVVTEQLMPDSLAYAFRLARWSGLVVAEVVPGPHNTLRDDVELRASALAINNLPMVAVMMANGKLNANLHDIDHKSSHKTALDHHVAVVQEAAELLIISAEEQADAMALDAHDVAGLFQGRLDSLRERWRAAAEASADIINL